MSPDGLTAVEALRGRTPPAISPSAGHSPTVSSAGIAAPKPYDDQVLLESFVHNAAENSHISTPSGIDTAGAVMDRVSSVTSSNSFDTVLGYLDKFVKIGDAISEVG
jgi:hypothetical protein